MESSAVPWQQPYSQMPLYRCAGEVSVGWDALCAGLPAAGAVVAADGPAILDWDALIAGTRAALGRRDLALEVIDLREHMVPWDQVVRRTAPVERLRADPDFATLARGALCDLFDQLPATRERVGALVLVAGPGAALADHDVLWYADLPKRHAESAVAAGTGHNLGQRRGTGPPSARRLFYLDWPLLDRHRDRLGPRIDRWIDMQTPDAPRWLSGVALRATLRELSGQPFRTRPVFNSTPWGGHWAQAELGFNRGARNTALGYELIAPESGILLGGGARFAEIPLQLLVALHPGDVLGPDVSATFGTSFPIRFDYLDTVGGGNLSVHCHPTEQDMRDVFGWHYTQHESYYVLVSGAGGVIYLGLRAGASPDEFHRCAQAADEQGIPFDIERFVQTFQADQHQLFLIPAGTPHASSAGNVVLEISATPYLYSLRFYDWLRSDDAGTRRPVHVAHAFRNLNRSRTGTAIAAELVQPPRTLRAGAGWREELIGDLPEMFYTVRRLALTGAATLPQHTAGRFHVLTVVDGPAAALRWPGGCHPLAYAETVVVPAAVGEYSVTSGPQGARLVQAVVR